MKKKIFCVVYTAVFIIICFLPGVLTAFLKNDESQEKRKLSEFPKIKKEGALNTDFTKEFDTYFSEHFAFRNKFVALNAELMSAVFNVSSEDDVIKGRDGWLYYGYTADDFTGIRSLEQWEIEDTARIIEMTEKYAEKCGVKMIFAAVPNKNTIYPEYMPYNYIKRSSESPLERLEKELSERNIAYCSLTDVLAFEKKNAPEKRLYHKTDTHWNNYGALIACRALCNELGTEISDIYGEGVIEKTWEGDLQKMLFPDSEFRDEQVNYGTENTYNYVGRFRGLDDLLINTVCAGKNNSLLMFRDSFGEAILPFMAENFGNAKFSRIVPYNVDELETGAYDFAVLEIVERNLRNLRNSAPVMPSPEYDEDIEYITADKPFADCRCCSSGNYMKVYGVIDDSFIGDKSRRILAAVNGKIYEAFPVYEKELLGGTDTEKKHGYSLNLNVEDPSDVEIIIGTDSGFVSTGKLHCRNDKDGTA